MSNFYSALYKAKGMGAAGSGVHHWWTQRLTAILLAPLTLWFMWQLKIYDYSMKEILSFPANLILAPVFVITAFYHSKLGMQVIIEDYISCLKLRFGLLVLLDIFVFITIVATNITLIYL